MKSIKCFLFIIIFVLCIGIIFIPASGNILMSKPLIINSQETVLYVGGVEPGNYSTIQGAINDANPGDTVFVYDDSSPYNENVRVHKSINLIGEDRNTTIINGIDWLYSVVKIDYNVNNALISGFTITDKFKGSEGCIGVGIAGNNNIIQNNKIIFNEYGIKIYDDSSNNTISDNIILHNCFVGIYDDCRDSMNKIYWNVIGGNGDPDYIEGGIYKHHSGGYFHHNDFELNWGYNAYTDWSSWGVWDDGSKGNYWDNWGGNPGYPDVYIIEGNYQDQIDKNPSSIPYFNYPIVRIDKSSYKAEPYDPISFYTHINVPSSSVTFFWEFGDGTTSNKKNPEYAYNKSGIYQITVTITDNKGVSDTDRSTAYIGLPPDKPIIKGPTKGGSNQQYEYLIVANDSDSNFLHYYIDWGDLSPDYIGPYPRGEVIKVNHTWFDEGDYIIQVKAIDETLLESEWAYLTVEIPRNRASSYPRFEWLFERFPMLERVLNFLI